MAIVGNVGSGKSSILSAILGETARLSGGCSIQVKCTHALAQCFKDSLKKLK